MGDIVCKFGGSSLADADQIRKAADIVRSDSRRRYVVPSAPGKRTPKDTKVTDLLYLCHEQARQHVDIGGPIGLIRDRFRDIADELGANVDVDGLVDDVESEIVGGATVDHVASRGEYLCGKVVSAHLGATFVDPVDAIRFRPGGSLADETYDRLSEQLSGQGLFVVPGFYGADSEGRVKTFSRGGSDITGAVVAKAVGGEIYENWTDVSGLLMADPALVPDALPVREITYREIRELSYMGARVFHDEAMFPVRSEGIPIHIRNTNRPDDEGTRILLERDWTDVPLVGVAGRTNFTMLSIEKALMNSTMGFGRKVLEIIASHDISYEHTPTGIDTMSVIISDDELDGKGDDLLDEIIRVLEPDRAELHPGLALIATVGEGMSHRVGIAATLFTALAEANVNIRVIDQGSSEINIIVGVEEADFNRAVQAIYRAFLH